MLGGLLSTAGSSGLATPPLERLLASPQLLRPVSKLEAQAWLDWSDDSVEKAEEALASKQAWLEDIAPSIDDVAPVYRSEGWVAALEPYADANGDPLVFSNGMPHGSRESVARQVSYFHERVIARCVATDRPALRATTIVNVRSPTFRFPDAACIAAIVAQAKRYPWSSAGTTVFVGCPRPVTWAFEKLRPFLSKAQYDSIAFAEVDELGELASTLPAELGGDAEWTVDAYIAERAAAEGVDVAPGVQRYRGPRLNFAMLDRVGKDAKPDAATEAAMAVEVDETAAAVEAAEAEAEEADEPGRIRRVWSGVVTPVRRVFARDKK